MSFHPPPLIEIVHRLEGRLRLRVFWLHDHPWFAPRLIDALSRLDGVDAVQVRAYTGSVLVEHQPDRIDEGALLDAVRRVVGGHVRRTGEELPDEVLDLHREAFEEGTDLARSAAALLKSVDAGIVRATEGRADAATLAAAVFLAAGAVEIVGTGKLPIPPWFQLAWWAFRTFATLEQRTIEGTAHPLRRVTH